VNYIAILYSRYIAFDTYLGDDITELHPAHFKWCWNKTTILIKEGLFFENPRL
jgi:hypothetical protein